MKKINKIFISLLVIFISGCGKDTSNQCYRIGVDPTFFPIELKGQTINMFAFSNELLQEISRIETMKFTLINTSWDNLLEGLKLNKYDGALSSLTSNLINNAKYSFSNTYIKTGPVLIVPIKESGISLKDLGGKIVAIEKTEIQLELMSQYTNVEIVFYDRIQSVLNDVGSGKYNACLIPTIQANAYAKNISYNQLTINSDPLTTEGVKLITLNNENTELITLFNNGLKKLIDNGRYNQLMEKWFKIRVPQIVN